MPLTVPLTSALNLTPTSTEAVSGSLAFAGTADAGQIVQMVQAVADGVTAFDAADAGPAPTAFVAVTVKVYVVALVRPGTITLVAGGVPVTVVAGCAVVPT